MGLLCLLPSMSWGLQTITTNNHEKTSIEVSQEGFNRIFIEGDRIQAVKGNTDQYRLQSDEQLGEIYIKPSIHESFHVFISTEKRKTLQLVFNPTEIEPDTIQIVIAEPEGLSLEESDPIKTSWMEIINAIRKGETSINSKVRNITTSKYKPLQMGLHSRIVQLIESKNWQAEIYRLKNSSNHAINTSPHDFHTKNTMAIFLTQNTIHPQQEVTLYKVVKHD